MSFSDKTSGIAAHDLIAWWVEALKHANKNGLLWEFLSSMQDSLQITDEQVIKAVKFARREWDL